MASISSLSSSSSIYGSRNVISGLASGMDTESMVENAISGQKIKLDGLFQKRQKIEWQQESFRGIIEKTADFNLKYTSYTSDTNLMSAGFFDSAMLLAAQGANASKVSATGRTDSTVQVDSVKQLATAARLNVGTSRFQDSATASKGVDLQGSSTVGTLEGSLTIGYGGKSTVQISFDSGDVFTSAQEMADCINRKLEEEMISFGNGNQEKASERIKAVAVDGKISLQKAQGGDGNSIWISNAYGNLETALGISPSADNKDLHEFTFDSSKVTKTTGTMDILAEKGFSITLDGVSKTVKGPTLEEIQKVNPGVSDLKDVEPKHYLNALQAKIDEAFGKDKLTVTNKASDGNLQLQFSAGSANLDAQFSVTTALEKELGMEGGLTSSLNLNKTLSGLLKDYHWEKARLEAPADAKIEKTDQTTESGQAIGKDADGNYYVQDKDEPAKWYRSDEKGNYLNELILNGKVVGTFSKDSTLKEVLDTINTSENSDVKAAYSSFTGKLTFTAKETGANGKVEFSGALGEKMFGTDDPAAYAKGQDAIFTVTVNGEQREVTQSSNTVNIDGMTLTMKETFDDGAVTFRSEVDADKIVDAVKEMVKDYNEMVKELRKAFNSPPLTNSKGKGYEPLTEKDREGMSESAIKAHEEKAKTGLLFGDRDLSNFYTELTNCLNVLGTSGSDPLGIGLTTSFSLDGTELVLDEKKLREALETDPNKVKDVFTRSKANGAKTDGLMKGLQGVLNQYVSITGAYKGILVGKAGTPLAPTSIYQNELQDQLNRMDEQIDRMQGVISDQIDYYNRQFTALEKMVAQMNNQSSMLMGFTGGGY